MRNNNPLAKGKINNNLIDFLIKEEGVSIKGTPSSFELIKLSSFSKGSN